MTAETAASAAYLRERLAELLAQRPASKAAAAMAAAAIAELRACIAKLEGES